MAFALTGFTLFVCALYLLTAVGPWLASFRVLGLGAVEASGVAIELDLYRAFPLGGGRRPHAATFAATSSLVGAAILAFALALGLVPLVSAGAVVLSLGIGHFFIASAPTVVLYLSGSGPLTVETQLMLVRAASPHRVGTLLLSARDATQGLSLLESWTKPGFLKRAVLLNSDFRQGYGRSWRGAVATLMRTAAIIAIDERSSTAFVTEEAEMIAALGVHWKTLVIRNASAPELDSDGSPGSQATSENWTWGDQDQVVAAVDSLLHASFTRKGFLASWERIAARGADKRLTTVLQNSGAHVSEDDVPAKPIKRFDCQWCEGTGRVASGQVCRSCLGAGFYTNPASASTATIAALVCSVLAGVFFYLSNFNSPWSILCLGCSVSLAGVSGVCAAIYLRGPEERGWDWLMLLGTLMAALGAISIPFRWLWGLLH